MADVTLGAGDALPSADGAPTTDHLSDDVDDTALADSLALKAPSDDPFQEANSDVGEQLLAHRAARGMTLEEAAAGAKIDVEHLAEAEDGIATLDEDELGRLADVYGIATSAFFGGRVTPYSYLAGA